MATPNNVNITKAILGTINLDYASRLPEVTKANIAEIGNTILDYLPLRNAFVSSLYGLIISQRIESVIFENPLGVLKKDPMRYGETEQEIFVSLMQGREFDGYADVDSLYGYYASNIMTAYHKVSPAIQYPITITYDNLRTAFMSEYGIRDLINAKIRAMYSSANYDEYLAMKEIFTSAYKAGHLYQEHISDIVDENTGKEFTIKMKELIVKMKFPNTQYNIAGASSCANDDSVFYMVTPEVDARLSVDVLAYAFNMDKAQVNAHKIVVDSFSDPHIKAIVFDMRFLNVKEQFRTLSDSKNGASLTWNYFYTIKEMFSYSPFFPCIALTTDDRTSTYTIAIDADQTVGKGQELTVKYTVTGEDGKYTNVNVDWEITSDVTSKHTHFIPGTNILMVGIDETATTINVKATSRIDSTQFTTATITVG